MPLVYVDFPALHEEAPADDLIALVKEFQWEDWTNLRFADRTSSDYRRGVAKLAERLVAANAAADAADVAAAAEALTEARSTPDSDDPGILDRIAAAEDALPQWSETLGRIGMEITRIGEAMERANVEMQESDRSGKGFAGRLRVARGVADDVAEPSTELLQLGNDFTTQLHAVDNGIRTLVEQAVAEVESDPNARDDVCEFFDTVRQLARASDDGLGMLTEMIDAIEPLERMSRDLRTPLRALRQGLTLMLEGRDVTREWVAMIDRSPVECDGESARSNGEKGPATDE
jgi:hypothetical protein